MSDLTQLAADLASAPDRVMREVKQVVSKGALNVKQQLVSEAQGSRSFRSLGRSIGYDLNTTADSVEGEIGPDKSRNSSAGLLMAYYGQSRGGGGTLPDPLLALQAEEPGFVAALDNVAGVVLE